MLDKILSAGKVLVLDDEAIVRESLSGWLLEDGLEVVTAECGAKALQVIANQTFDLMLVDLKMPDIDGFQFIQKAQDIQPQTPALIMTAYASVDTAKKAIKDGAYDYITKPFDPEEISKTIQEIFYTRRLLSENIQLRLHIKELYDFHHIISKNQQMLEILELIGKIADSRSSVLIQGESGTGKELIAKAIHFNSRRSSKPFVAVPCAYMPESLFERALFGCEQKPFSDEESFRKGSLERAAGGTLFLDEIGALSSRMQKKLLFPLQEREFMRVGGKRPIHGNTRVISTTSRDLQEGIQENWFREDLYYRINVHHINLLPLRDRKEDIPLLVEHFISKFNVIDSRKVKGVNDESLDLLMKYEWPGNIRELENVVEQAMLVNSTGFITPVDLPPHITSGTEGSGDAMDSLSLEAIERAHIARILQRNDWDIKKTADVLKIDHSTLCAKIKKFDLCPKNLSMDN